jgi:hypothetical protein
MLIMMCKGFFEILLSKMSVPNEYGITSFLLKKKNNNKVLCNIKSS